MTLAVQSREILDTLESWVREIFSEIPNNNLTAVNFDEFSDPFNTPEFYKLCKVIPLNHIRKVELTWTLPDVTKYYRVKPQHYLVWLIGHEGEGSILSYLKRKNWALELCAAETSYDINSMFPFIKIAVDLTEDGLNHVFEVITVIFEYFETLRRLGPQERIYQEIQTVVQNDFRWQEVKTTSFNYVQRLSINLQLFPDDDIITGDQLMFKFDSKVIAEIQDILVPEKCNIMVVSQSFDEDESTKMHEKWFQTPYFIQDIDQEWLTKWKKLEVNPHIRLPDVNKFIAINYEIKNADFPQADYPIKIMDNKQCRLWYKKDNKFNVPKAHICIHLIAPVISNSPQSAVLFDMFDGILSQNLSDAVYPAIVAGLSHEISSRNTGLYIHVNGYNDKLPILFETILDHIDNFTVKDELFEVVKSNTLESYLEPSALCDEIRSTILHQIYWTYLDKRVAAGEVTKETLVNFVNMLKMNCFVECLVQGNMTGKEAIEMVELVQSKFKCTEIPINQILEDRAMQLNEVEKYCRVSNPGDGHSVITNYYQWEPGNIHKSCLMELFLSLMDEPCFTTLRTQQQLGYDVGCWSDDTCGILGFTVTVHTQADKFSVSQVDKRIEAFLRDFIAKLENNITEKEFQTQVTSLIRLKRCVDLQLEDEVDRNWTEINSGNYLFDRRNLEVEHLNKITLAELREFVKYEELFGVGKKLRKLSIQVVGVGKIQENEVKLLKRRHSCQRSLSLEKPFRVHSKSDLPKIRSKSQKSFHLLESPSQDDHKEYKFLFSPEVANNPLFINDIHGFKNGLMIYPVIKIIK